MTFTATDDCGNTSKATKSFRVSDDIAPEFVESLPADTTVNCDAIPSAVSLTVV